MKNKPYPKSIRVNHFEGDGYCAFRAYAYICDKYGNKDATTYDIGNGHGYKHFEFDWGAFFDDNNIPEDKQDDPDILSWSDEVYHYELQQHIAEWVQQCLTCFSDIEWEAKDVRLEEVELEDVAEQYSDKFFVALVHCPDLVARGYDPYLWHINVIDKNVCYEKMDSDHVDTYKACDFIFFPKEDNNE